MPGQGRRRFRPREKDALSVLSLPSISGSDIWRLVEMRLPRKRPRRSRNLD